MWTAVEKVMRGHLVKGLRLMELRTDLSKLVDLHFTSVSFDAFHRDLPFNYTTVPRT